MSCVQAPISALILNNITRGRIFSGLPFASTATAYRLFRGYTAALPGGAARTAYMNTNNKKSNSASENISDATSSSENTKNNNANLPKSALLPIVSGSVADTTLTQFSEMKSQLMRLGIIDQSFNCRTSHNIRVLMRAAFLPRLAVSFTNYSSFFILNDIIAQKTNVENKKYKYFVSGSACGAFAALLMLPVTYLRDTITAEMTAIDDKLIIPKVTQILSNFYSTIKRQGIKKLIHENGYRLFELAFLRVLRSSATLAIASGVIYGIGCEPLTPFFSNDNSSSFFNPERNQEKTSEVSQKNKPPSPN